MTPLILAYSYTPVKNLIHEVPIGNHIRALEYFKIYYECFNKPLNQNGIEHLN